MHVLLVECVPRRLKSELPDHTVRTTQEEGWAGLENGALLRAAAARFDVLLTVDRKMGLQQDLRGLSIGVVAMVARSNRLVDFRPLMPQVHNVLSEIRAGQVLIVGG